MFKRRLFDFAKKPDTLTFVSGIVVGLSVCAPLIGNRPVFLLDWSIGPHVGLATPSVLGLEGGLTSGVLASTVVAFLYDAIGSVVTWIPILLFFPVAMIGASRLTGGNRWARVASGLLYAVNPFVLNRIYVGHFPLLVGYALLPFAISATAASVSSSFRLWPVPALWWAGLTALSPHFAWIFGLGILGVALVALLSRIETFRRVIGWLATSVVLFVLMNAYILLPYSAASLTSQVGRVSLDLYHTTGDAHLGLLINVLGLYGFWRLGPGPILPKDILSGWPFLLITILIVVVVGASFVLRKPAPDPGGSNESVGVKTKESRGASSSMRPECVNPFSTKFNQRQLANLLLIIGVAGFFLALGSQGPTGWLFLWAYDHVPFFAIMREPQKFLMLLALTYAVFFGWGVGQISRIQYFRSRLANIMLAGAVGIALPLGYSANIFDGLNGQISASTVPPSYQQADLLMGTGEGNVLYLPWHLYMSYPFTNNRVVNNIGPEEFRRSVISGDNVQSSGVESQSTSPRSFYLEQLFSDGPALRKFGELVAPLGVEYVVLAKTVDWSSYSWLSKQNDLKRILDSPSLEVWRNLDYAGVGWSASTLQSVRGVDGLLTLGEAGDLFARTLVLGGDNASVSKTATPVEIGKSKRRQRQLVEEISPIAYRIRPGFSGWVTVDAPFQRGWYIDGRKARKSAEGTLVVKVDKQGGVLEFTPWRLVRLGYILAIATFFTLLALVILGQKFYKEQPNGRGRQKN